MLLLLFWCRVNCSICFWYYGLSCYCNCCCCCFCCCCCCCYCCWCCCCWRHLLKLLVALFVGRPTSRKPSGAITSVSQTVHCRTYTWTTGLQIGTRTWTTVKLLICKLSLTDVRFNTVYIVIVKTHCDIKCINKWRSKHAGQIDIYMQFTVINLLTYMQQHLSRLHIAMWQRYYETDIHEMQWDIINVLNN